LPDIFSQTGYVLRPFAALPLTTATLVLLLGIVVVARERASRISLLFFALTFSVSVWLFSFSLMYATDNPRFALFWAKAAFLGIPFIPTAAFHFIIGLERVERRLHNLIRGMWILSAFFALIILTTDQIVDGVEHYWWGFYPRYAWASGPYLLFFFFVLGAALRHAIITYRSAESEIERRRMAWVSLSLIVGYTACFDYLPSFGVDVLPLGFLAIAGFVVLMGHTVWRYELAEITASLAAPRILQTMHGNVLATDLDGKIRVISDAACSLLGYGEDDLIGKPAALISPDLKPDMHEGSREMVWLTRKGESVDVNVSAATVSDPRGRRVGILYNAEDISRRKREEALRESEARYRTLVESMNEGVMLVDPHGVIQFANRRMAQMLGYMPGEVVGKLANSFIEPRAREGDRAVQLRTLRRRELWAEISEAQQVDARGKVIGTIRVHTDVTDRHRAELALRESEARYRLLAEYATDMISRHTPDGRFLYASPAARSLAGYGPEELIGTTPAELVHPEDLPTLNRLRSTSLASKTPTTFTYRLRRKDGNYIWVETTWRPIREGASDTVSELVAVSRDITDRKRAESAMDDVGAKRS
jgi:PAS domain S-box-containing protein